MKPIRALLALLVPISLFALGCTEDVGSCDDPLRGRDTVVIGGSIQYGGQAILNASCTAGCHSSTAKGEARHGAPEGLDFDLQPIDEADATGTLLKDADGNTVFKLTSDQLHGLRARQRDVFEKRNAIWQQVKDGLMPPTGMFAAFRKLVSIKDSSETNPCMSAKNGFMDITAKASQDVLRNWLACSVPIVEGTGPSVTVKAGDNGAQGTAGYQYGVCDGTTQPIGDGGVADAGTSDGGPAKDGGGTPVVTLTQIYDPILVGTMCMTCHPSLNPKNATIDVSDIDTAYATLVTDKSVKCNGKPYVTPGDPSKSWLYDVVTMDSPGCSTTRMPMGKTLTTSQTKLISDWITGGAMR